MEYIPLSYTIKGKAEKILHKLELQLGAKDEADVIFKAIVLLDSLTDFAGESGNMTAENDNGKKVIVQLKE